MLMIPKDIILQLLKIKKKKKEMERGGKQKNVKPAGLWEINGYVLGQLFLQNTTANWKCL